ncbi:hypothetical protein KAU34_04095 [candidate division WOR-3 bacterium]|nr:hypothetical protein [candidate division WOR-3 bacterium]
MRTKFYNLTGKIYPEEEEHRTIYFPGQRAESCLLLNGKNNIWIEKRKELAFEERVKPYKLLGIENWLQKDSKKRINYLDLHFLDPLTGIMNQGYLHVFPRKSWKKTVMLYVNNECIEQVNNKLSWEMGDIVLYVAASILRKVKDVIVRSYYNGLYFFVFNAHYDSIIEAKMKLSKTSIFFSNGYQIKGIGLQLKDTVNFPHSYPLTKIWGTITNTKILKAAPITKEVEWANIFICSEFYGRIEGELLNFIWNG